MALPTSRSDREYKKFEESTAGDVAVRVVVVDDSGSGVPDTNIAQFGGTAVTLGQKTSAASIPVVLPSDAAAAGASSTLIADLVSPADGSVAFTSNVSVTCAGFPVTVDSANCTVVYVMYKPTGGTWQTPLVNGAGGVSLSAAANVITVAGAGTPFAAGDTYVVGIQWQKKGYDPTGDAIRVSENYPMNQQAVQESWADTTNVGAGPTYYPSADGKEMTGIKSISFTGKIVEADAETNTITIEGTNDEDATSTNRTWITLYGYRTDTDAYVNSLAQAAGTLTYAWDFDNCNYKYVRAKFVGGASATNTLEIKARTVAI